MLHTVLSVPIDTPEDKGDKDNFVDIPAVMTLKTKKQQANRVVLKPPRYIGCFMDDKYRDVNKGPHKYGYTYLTCQLACVKFKYFALQNGGWCVCGNKYGTKPKYKKVGNNQCGRGPNRKGGRWRNAVYLTNTGSFKIGTPKYIGCFMDDKYRDLNKGPHKYGYTYLTCQYACLKFKYFALQNGGWCVCGDRYHTKPKYKKVGNNQCGRGPHRKGRGWRNAVYLTNGAPPTQKPTKAPPTTKGGGYYYNGNYYFSNGTKYVAPTKKGKAPTAGTYKYNGYYYFNNGSYVGYYE